MIEIIEKDPFGMPGRDGGFAIDGSEFEVRSAVRDENWFRIVIADKSGEVFTAATNPDMLGSILGLFCTPLRKKFFLDNAGRLHFSGKLPDGSPETPMCVDSRVIMAFILYVWCYEEDDDKEFNAAINPLPSLEEATEWLCVNRFCGDNRYKNIRVLGDKKLDNVPPAIQALHDKRYGAATKYIREPDDEEWEEE